MMSMSPWHRVLGDQPTSLTCCGVHKGKKTCARSIRGGDHSKGLRISVQIPAPDPTTCPRTWQGCRAAGRVGRAAGCSRGCPCTPCRGCRGSQSSSRSLKDKRGCRRGQGSCRMLSSSHPHQRSPYRGSWGDGGRGVPGATCLRGSHRTSCQR